MSDKTPREALIEIFELAAEHLGLFRLLDWLEPHARRLEVSFSQPRWERPELTIWNDGIGIHWWFTSGVVDVIWFYPQRTAAPPPAAEAINDGPADGVGG